MPVRERLRISEACPLILPYHVALDHAREQARGKKAIGTTGRGIGPAYEDKVARRGLRLGDLFHRERFSAKLEEVLDYHNFALKHYFKAESLDYQQVLEETLSMADDLRNLTADWWWQTGEVRETRKPCGRVSYTFWRGLAATDLKM